MRPTYWTCSCTPNAATSFASPQPCCLRRPRRARWPAGLPAALTPLPTLDPSVRVSRLELADGPPVELLRRPGGGALPVVVYPAGPGQHESAGQRWRWAWAEAGYAVVSLQPLDEDLNAWRLELARTGSLRSWGGCTTACNPAQRLQATVAALTQLRTQLPAGEWDWQRGGGGLRDGRANRAGPGQAGSALAVSGVMAISPQPEPPPRLSVGPRPHRLRPWACPRCWCRAAATTTR